MESFAKSGFWRTLAVLALLLLAADVALRLYSLGLAGRLLPLHVAVAGGGGVINVPQEGIVTTNEDGTAVYFWGPLQAAQAGKTVVKFDVKSMSIDRFDLK